MRASIGAADLDWLCARATSGGCTQRTAAIRIAAEPARAATLLRLDAIIVGSFPACGRRRRVDSTRELLRSSGRSSRDGAERDNRSRNGAQRNPGCMPCGKIAPHSASLQAGLKADTKCVAVMRLQTANGTTSVFVR